MLAKANRVITGAEFRSVVRTGRRATSPIAVVYSTRTGDSSPTRFGFIVAKSVGGSVVRNRMRRRLRSIGRELLESRATGHDIVVRPLPASTEASWVTLHTEIINAVTRSVERR
ncbi:ribonuclease P protein component [Glaciihabitans arcticus]|uniref:Ribonuclease P protein component n=1 Tax=Glaciihabitans arcticus TaxID=2668039 RepID=A0A4Q9GZ82_9MICO|nr:ribonuclease P protein component [Glaciihabitans arcticus]TBN58143.1 ribonuclease P protein component [Glaciihabitans arcticus]